MAEPTQEQKDAAAAQEAEAAAKVADAEKAKQEKEAEAAAKVASKGKVVTFVADSYPFVRGDVINISNLEKDELKNVKTSHYVKGALAFDELPDREPVEEE